MGTEKQLKYIDLFAGCGGLSLGLHEAGWKGLFAIEKSPDAFQTLQYNLIDKLHHFDWPKWLPEGHHDINDVLKKYAKDLKGLKNKVDLLAGGPPCQGFSMAGRRREDDVRNNLVHSYLEFIELVKPKLIMFENVKGFTMEFKKNKEKGIAYSHMVKDELDKMGYYVQGRLINFGEYGVPQKRTRFILIGMRKNIKSASQEKVDAFFQSLEMNKFEFLKARGLTTQTSLGDAISDLLKANGVGVCVDAPRFEAGQYGRSRDNYQKLMRTNRDTEIPDSHRFAHHLSTTVAKFRAILDLTKERRNLDLSADIRTRFNIKKHTVIPLSKIAKSPTITTLPDDYIHYEEPRILTVREYARIQTFPDWYMFRGKYTTGGKLRTKEAPRYTQIGNAIPPLFAEQAGYILKNLVNG